MSFPTLHILLAFLLLGVPVSGQVTSAQNDITSIANDVRFTMDSTIKGMPINPALAPLTDDAGRRGSLSQRESIQPSGLLYLTTSESVKDVQSGYISFISCEPADYPGNLGSTDVIRLVVNSKPAAIVLYSTHAASCTFQATDGFSYGSIYSMLDTNYSTNIVDNLKSDDAPNMEASIHLNGETANETRSSNGNILGKSPTTAVAMIILYSITGIITALFLIIIVVGAVRAHRHPERYGPRHVVGRPRQSRAKGIARAMLETLPIRKFGEDTDKPAEGAQDVELGSKDVENRENSKNTTTGSKLAGSSREEGTEDGPDVVKTEPAAGSEQQQQSTQPSSNPIDDGLACSVCTDDFVKGQDIRVLPCKHNFHPDCIDPWLLNVSGTCPLCRIDLHPRLRNDDADEGDHIPTLETVEPNSMHTTGNAEPGEGEDTRRNRRSRILSTLNIGRMRHATPQERLEALRTLRNEQNANTEDSTRHRFSRRLSRALVSRPVSGVPSRPVSEVPPAASGGLPSTAESGPVQGPHEPVDRRRQGSFAG